MPVVIQSPPQQAVEVRTIGDVDESATPQGLEGRQVRQIIEGVRHHWRQQSMGAIVAAPSDLLDELSRYQHPPFEHAGKIRVRVSRFTDLQPRPFVFDEEDE